MLLRVSFLVVGLHRLTAAIPSALIHVLLQGLLLPIGFARPAYLVEDRKPNYMAVEVLLGHLPFLIPMQVAHLERHRTGWLIVHAYISPVLVENVFNKFGRYIHHQLVVYTQLYFVLLLFGLIKQYI